MLLLLLLLLLCCSFPAWRSEKSVQCLIVKLQRSQQGMVCGHT
jgi:hypothetical protein